mmetsp:Transcript_19663/g.39895  ORF Transcript_19663/g.39895 Transcript_19663/m.39895 type:complete len:236 (+) Transcript_19663:152-859(+)
MPRPSVPVHPLGPWYRWPTVWNRRTTASGGTCSSGGGCQSGWRPRVPFDSYRDGGIGAAGRSLGLASPTDAERPPWTCRSCAVSDELDEDSVNLWSRSPIWSKLLVPRALSLKSTSVTHSAKSGWKTLLKNANVANPSSVGRLAITSSILSVRTVGAISIRAGSRTVRTGRDHDRHDRSSVVTVTGGLADALLERMAFQLVRMVWASSMGTLFRGPGAERVVLVVAVIFGSSRRE